MNILFGIAQGAATGGGIFLLLWAMLKCIEKLDGCDHEEYKLGVKIMALVSICIFIGITGSSLATYGPRYSLSSPHTPYPERVEIPAGSSSFVEFEDRRGYGDRRIDDEKVPHDDEE
jgi:hypothetical protein